MEQEDKGADQLHSYREAGLRLCFCICRLLVFWCTCSNFVCKEASALQNKSTVISMSCLITGLYILVEEILKKAFLVAGLVYLLGLGPITRKMHFFSKLCHLLNVEVCYLLLFIIGMILC